MVRIRYWIKLVAGIRYLVKGTQPFDFIKCKLIQKVKYISQISQVFNVFWKFENNISYKKKEHNQHSSVLWLSYYLHVNYSLIQLNYILILSWKSSTKNSISIHGNSKARRESRNSRPVKSNPVFAFSFPPAFV